MKLLKNISEAIIRCFERGGKLLVFGNGGSAAESSHFAAEFIGIYLPAIALNDPAVLTSLANDFDYDLVFSKQIIALGKPGDLAIGISSSGKSDNVLIALEEARELELEVIDWPRIGKGTAQIQENQLRLIHEVFEQVRNHFRG